MIKKTKREALTVQRLITEVLVSQLSIPLRQIVNDTTFKKYTEIQRPDLLISEFEFDGERNNEVQFIENLVAYAEVKDNCSVNDRDWKDALEQGKKKSKQLKMPYFIITNCKTSIFYNATTGKEISLNGNPIREFQTIDIFRLIKNKLKKDVNLENIQTNVDSLSVISEAIFNKKLWELAGIYRGISFKDNQQKIDFTIGFIALEFFEEKELLDGKKDVTKIYWSDCEDNIDEKLVANLCGYIKRLKSETDFVEFRNLIEGLEIAISGDSKNVPLVNKEDIRAIYNVINSMRPLHGCGFDLFGAVYEMFASTTEKKDFGEYFTRRHYAHILSKLLLKKEIHFNENKKFKVLDLACGTGGFLTESFKVLLTHYQLTATLDSKSKKFLQKECFYGIDVREENIQRTKLNMFLVGDGHTNMTVANTLKRDFKGEKFDYIITNPPYGNGTLKAETSTLSTTRYEIAFLCKILSLLEIGGEACVVIPDGILENPSYELFRKEILEKCNIQAIVSIPKFAFAPYTKEKTYALFFKKRSEKITKIQGESIWMYIVDNDGLANSDKRFPTKLRNERNGWKHDEISGWVSVDGEEKPGILEERWMSFDDLTSSGSVWIDEKGIKHKMRKGGHIKIEKVNADNYYNLLPEYYIRPYEPNFIKLEDLDKEITQILSELHSLKV
ncbi:N-6 DNA methylase [Candidatus Peregrinibacteria bacterium]|nr:N-6 DNA methylase [Candidatus Peregrinibacteria bacterium]